MVLGPERFAAWSWTMNASLGLAILACLAFAGWVVRAYRAIMREEKWLPKELSGAKLVYSEQLFSGPAEMPIVARVDRVYLRDGLLHLVELKTRRRIAVYETDVIELSAQRVAVQASTGIDVGLSAFVVIEHPDTGRRHVRVVALLTEDRVAALLERRRAIIAGVLRPKETDIPGRCATCEYRGECKGESGAKVFPLVRIPANGAAKLRSLTVRGRTDDQLP
jgi:CRISPR-associated exonuclease Cas4